MDADEFYLEDDINSAKSLILEENITHAYCPIVNYGFLPTKRLIKKNYASVQIFSKLTKNSKLGFHKNSIAVVDPTRMMSDFKGSKHFYTCQTEMHHMTFIRKDITKKIQNSTARDVIDKFDDNLIKNINNCSLDCNDIFNLLELTNRINPLLKEYAKEHEKNTQGKQ